MKQAGFTLMELLVALAIIGVVASLGYPSFRETIRKSNIQSATTNVLNAMMTARSEAVKTNMPVTFCQSLPGSTRVCSHQNDWNKGWIILRGADVVAASNEMSEKVIIRSMAGTAFKTDLVYNPEGRLDGFTGQVFSVCSLDTNNGGKQIVIDPTGRPRVSSESVTCF